MSLTARTKNVLVDRMNTCFATIGVNNGTKMPKSGNNREPVAWELWVAHHLTSLANKRKANAEDAAIKAGVIFDKEKNPKPPGTKEATFSGEVVTVSVEVRKPTTRVNVDKLLAFLAATKKVSRSTLDAAVEHATETNRAAHVFDTMLITDDTN